MKRFQKLAVIVTIAIKYDWYAFTCEEKVDRHISQFAISWNHLGMYILNKFHFY